MDKSSKGRKDAVSEELCPCGKPLHYSDPRFQKLMEWVIGEKGEYAEVEVFGTSGRKVWVPRHFIALHGLLGNGDLPEEWVIRYGFEYVKYRTALHQ
jgi:hypothetical protein